MGFFTYFLRDMEQILFPNREQHAIPSMDGALSPNDRLDACSPIGEPMKPCTVPKASAEVAAATSHQVNSNVPTPRPMPVRR